MVIPSPIKPSIGTARGGLVKPFFPAEDSVELSSWIRPQGLVQLHVAVLAPFFHPFSLCAEAAAEREVMDVGYHEAGWSWVPLEAGEHPGLE